LLRVEERIPEAVCRELQARGHKLEVKESWSEGDVLGICVDLDRGIVRGGADPRGEQSKRMPSYAIGW
jgi:gamma-glutamyltranspeptidase